MIKEAIYKLVNKEDLSSEMAEAVMEEIMKGEASQASIAAYLTGLRLKGETIEEITASARGMRRHCIRLLHEMDVLEIVGTGGDESNSFNISTTTSIVVSAAGIPVAKHGNRSVSSKCGAADLLEKLGVNIMVSSEKSTKILEEIGICFMFAQNYHLSMKHVAPVRKDLGIRTLFNILGPLTSPAGSNMQLLGVYDEGLVEPLARVLSNLGVKKGMVVYGQDGLDEISLSAPTTCANIRNGVITKSILRPEDFGFEPCNKEELVGGDPKENARITREILKGAKGPKREAVIMNAATCLYMIHDNITIKEAVEKVAYVIDSGKAQEQLDKFIQLSNS